MLNRAIVVAFALASIGHVNALWPVPQDVSTGKDVLFIEKSIKITYNGQPVRLTPYPTGSANKRRADQEGSNQVNRHLFTARAGNGTQSPFNSKTIVNGGVQRAFNAIFEQGLVPWMLHKPGSDFEPAPGSGRGTIKSLKISQTSKDSSITFKPIAGTVDESYTLNLTSNGEASIQAASSIGVLRGLETFTQLFYKHSSGHAWYTSMAPVTINDSPNFPYRGILLDVARHWFPVSDIKRTIDGAAMAKMNIIHIHVTESQSWPLEIPTMPELTTKGSFAPGLTYSPEDIRGIQEYSTARGVQAIFEIDMPGHFRVEQAFPELSVAYNAKPYYKYCSSPPCGALKLNNTDVEDFLDRLFDDLLPRLSPYSSYFHTGGDEYKPAISLLDPDLKTQDMKVLKPLLQKFLDHAHKKVREHGLIPMVWEEMIGEWGAILPKDTIIQSWFNTVADLAKAGHKVIDSTTDIYVSTARFTLARIVYSPRSLCSILIVVVVAGSILLTTASQETVHSLTGAIPRRTGT